MKIFKKQFSVLMTLLMVLTLVPISAFAQQVPSFKAENPNQTFTIADTDKEVIFRISMGSFLNVKKGKVLFEIDNAKLAKSTGIAKATLYQGTVIKSSPDIVFAKTDGTALSGGENLFNLEINSDTIANNKDSIEIVIALRLDFSDSEEGAVQISIRDLESDGTATGIGTHSLAPAINPVGDQKDLEIKVNNSGAKIGPAGGSLSDILLFEFKKLSATTSENKLVVGLPSGFLFSPPTKVTSDKTNPVVSYSSDKSEMTITNINKNTGFIKIEPIVILKANDSAKNGKIMADFDLKTNEKSIFQKDEVIGELVAYGLTVTAKESGKKEIPTLAKGMPKTVELNIKAVDGTLTNGAKIDLDVDGAEIVFNTVKVVEPAGLVLSTPKSAGTKDTDKVSGYEVYADNNFSLRTHKYDVQNIKLTFDIVESLKSKDKATVNVSTSRVDDQKIDIAKISKVLEVMIIPAQVDKGVKPALPNVVIKETAKNLLKKGDKIYLEIIYPGSGSDKGQHVAFEAVKNIKVETTNSLKIDSIAFGKQENILVLTIASRSYEGPGMITLSNIKGFLTEKAPMNQAYLQVKVNDIVEASTPFFSVVKPVALKTVFTINNKMYMLNGQSKMLVTAPYINNGRTMLPVRAVGESLGLEASWDNATKTATFKNDSKTAIVKIGQSTISVNNTSLPLTVPAEIKNGSTMIELRSLATAFGVNIHWDNVVKTVTVN